MGIAKVTVSEVDLSTRVPQFPGVYGGICISAKKGEVGVPSLVTSETQFMTRYTPDEKVEVGYDSAYYSALAFLEKSNKLWVVRVANSPLFGGISVMGVGDSDSTIAYLVGEADPDVHSFVGGEIFIIVGKDPGTWNNNIGIRIYNYTTSPDKVKESGAFLIEVYKGGSKVESFVCSRTPGYKDGYGRNIFVEDVLEASNFIKAVDSGVSQSTLPKEQTTTLNLAAGSDGSAVTASQMATALDQFLNPDDVPLTIIMDGGYDDSASLSVFKKKIISVCESRKDCVGILTVPYSYEDNADYINEITDYKKLELNPNTSYAALYSSHVRIYDKFNDRAIYVAGDGYVAAQISQTAAEARIWYPVAGSQRGALNIGDVRRRYSEGEADALVDVGINPILFLPGRGIAIWGHKTLLSRPSSLDRLNVRLLLIVIETTVKEALRDFLFQLNDEVTRASIEAILRSSMNTIKAQRGLYDFEVKCDSENNTPDDIDNYRLNVWLFVQPVKGIEDLRFSVIITRTGVDFKSAAEAL